jgi:transposase
LWESLDRLSPDVDRARTVARTTVRILTRWGGGGNSNSQERLAGVAVAKAHGDLALGPTGEVERFTHHEEGVSALIQRLVGWQPTLVVMAATGGAGEAAGGLGTRRRAARGGGDARQVRDFANAMGRLGKTDRWDARVLAQFAQAVRPEARPGRTADEPALAERLARRQQVVARRAQERTRLAMARYPFTGLCGRAMLKLR